MVLTAVYHHIQKMIDSLLQTHPLISRSVPYFPEQKRNFIVDDTDDQLGQGSVIIAVKEWLGDAYSLEYVLESGSLQPPLGQHFQAHRQQIPPHLFPLYLGIALL